MTGPDYLFRLSKRAPNTIMAAKWLCVFGLSGALSACVTATTPPLEPPGVTNLVRSEIRQLAVRGPSKPAVSLTSDLDGRGKASGKTALAASAVWLGGTMEAAADAEEAGLLVLAAGLIATPVIAAGGAMYGAAASDSEDAIAQGNQTLETVLEFAPDRMRHILEQSFSDTVPVHYEFAGDVSDAELAARGFNAVLDIHMDSVTSSPSDNDFHAWFSSANRAELRVFGRPDLTRQQTYEYALSSRAVSSWAKDGGRQLLVELDESYQTTAEEILDYYFLGDSVAVQGLEPVSRGWRVGQIPGTRPLFAWTARDGQLIPRTGELDYEVRIYEGRVPPESGIRTHSTSYVPDESLAECQMYRWQVRAHYESFGKPVSSDWTPVYRFKTQCNKTRSSDRDRRSS